MNIVILGGDGYLGWPTAMHFSSRGHSVTVVDNYFRRDTCTHIDSGMLYPVPNLIERAKLWYELTGKEIKVVVGDLKDKKVTDGLFSEQHFSGYQWAVDGKFSGTPDTIVHYAEQPSAPLSLMNYEYADFTLVNNLQVTNNIIWSIKEHCKDAHLIKLGTMGEYGTPNIDIEEGWLDVTHNGRSQKFLYPRQASSLYHTTKVMDTDLLWFAVRTWGLKVTDLMQGPVYGVETDDSAIDPRLRTIFNYDEVFGTIVNRFITQAIKGYPLTVYGKGGQTRGYLNIRDTLQCIEQSAKNPADQGELRIFNQIMETFSVNELAELTQKVGNKLGLNVEIKPIENPRKELEEHYYNPKYQGLLDLGVEPHYLTEESMEEIFNIVLPYQDNIREDVIFKGIKW